LKFNIQIIIMKQNKKILFQKKTLGMKKLKEF